jgi:ribosomal protein S18 acetylase RimI-like enzyme
MPDEVQVRSAERKDVEAIAGLNLAMARETEGRHLDLSTLTRGIHAVFECPNYGFYVVAERDGQVVGCLLITFEWSDWRAGLFWWIQSLYVRPAFRRRGVFRRLLEFIQAEALRRPDVCGLRLYVAESNHGAQAAYREMGMAEASYRMYEKMLTR